MGIYNIYLVNLIPQQHTRFLHFSEAAQDSVASRLQNLFDQVCAGTTLSPRASFLPGTPHSNELVVYFLPDRASSIIASRGGPPPIHNEGETAFVSGAMISEVYVGQAGPQSTTIANCAFHELMHNKLDMHPQLAVIRNLHTRGGGGIANRGVNFNSALTPRNKQLMRGALRLNIPQFWDPNLIYGRRIA
jgi:hypothetical protein